jgi:hypothetical protein
VDSGCHTIVRKRLRRNPTIAGSEYLFLLRMGYGRGRIPLLGYVARPKTPKRLGATDYLKVRGGKRVCMPTGAQKRAGYRYSSTGTPETNKQAKK